MISLGEALIQHYGLYFVNNTITNIVKRKFDGKTWLQSDLFCVMVMFIIKSCFWRGNLLDMPCTPLLELKMAKENSTSNVPCRRVILYFMLKKLAGVKESISCLWKSKRPLYVLVGFPAVQEFVPKKLEKLFKHQSNWKPFFLLWKRAEEHGKTLKFITCVGVFWMGHFDCDALDLWRWWKVPLCDKQVLLVMCLQHNVRLVSTSRAVVMRYRWILNVTAEHKAWRNFRKAWLYHT